MPFRFHELPDLIRCKILRQYVPVYTKASVLSHMSEFSDILNYNESWQHSFGKYPERYPSIPCIKPGIYICDNEWWKFFYIVSKDAESISFAFYSARCLLKQECPFNSEGNDWRTTLELTLSDLQEFLSKFAEGHTLWNERNVNYFWMYPDKICTVNHIKNTLCWIDGTMHSIRKNGKCYMKRGPKRYTEIVVRKNGTVETRPFGYHYRNSTRLEPLKLHHVPLNAYIESGHFDFKLKCKMEQDCSTSIDFSVNFKKLSPHQGFFFQMPIFETAIDNLMDAVLDYYLENDTYSYYEYTSNSSD